MLHDAFIHISDIRHKQIIKRMQTVKCVVVGDGDAGKTSMLVSYTTGKFHQSDIVFNDFAVTVMVGDKRYTLGLFDTAGQEDYDRVRPLSYEQTDVFLVCFSVISPSSYLNVQEKWVPEITRHCPRVPFLLVGTDADLRDDPKVLERLAVKRIKPISRDMGERLASEVKAVKYVECSVRSQKQLKEVFGEAVCAALEFEPAPPAESKNWKCLLL